MASTMNQQRSRTSPVPAIVIGAGITALGVIRSLGRHGIPVFNLSNERDLCRWSRWHEPLGTLMPKFADTELLAARLDALPFERAVLFPCSDSQVEAVAALGDRLGPRFATTATYRDVDLLTDKGRFAEALASLNVPHPRTTRIRDAADFSPLADQCFQHALLKPRHSQQFASHFGVKGFPVSTRRDAIVSLAQITAAGFDVVLQEYVPGPPTNHYFLDGFVDRAGRICGVLARRRLRMDPPGLGNSTYTVSVPLHEMAGALESLERLIAQIRLRGIFSAEFKLDDRDGEFKILEINARPWWFVEFTASCGVNVCLMAYRDALGLPVEAADSYAIGKGCIYLNRDRRASLRLHRDGQLSARAWAGTWIRSRGLIFNWDDPGPWLQRCLSRGRSFVQRRIINKRRAVRARWDRYVASRRLSASPARLSSAAADGHASPRGRALASQVDARSRHQ